MLNRNSKIQCGYSFNQFNQTFILIEHIILDTLTINLRISIPQFIILEFKFCIYKFNAPTPII